jgi:hypothetical protein
MNNRRTLVYDLYNSKEFNAFINKIDPAYCREDLKSEVMLALLDMPDATFNNIQNLKYYSIRMVMNMVTNTNHPFYKNFIRQSDPIPEHIITQSLHEDDISIESKKLYELVCGNDYNNKCITDDKELQIKKIFDGLYWYDRDLTLEYLELGSFRKVEKETQIFYVSVQKTVSKVIKHIRQKAGIKIKSKV